MNTSPHTIQQLQVVIRVIRRSVWRGIRRFYEYFLAPYSSNEDAVRKERITTWLLFSVVVMLVLYGGSMVIIHIRSVAANISTISSSVYWAIVTIFIALYVLCRKGYFHTAAVVFVACYFTATFYGSYHWGASMPIGLLSYGLIIVIASITISTRAGIITAILACCGLLISGIHEINTIGIATWKQSDIQIHNIIEYSIMLCVTALLSWLSHREIELSLYRARASESLLQQERDNLERTVEARTIALQQAEHERITQLRQFAEFGKISAGAFHDLLNPLMVVSMTVEELDNQYKNTESTRAKERIAIAIRSTQKMQRYIESLRSSLKHPTFSEVVAINDEITTVLEVVQFHMHREMITYTFVPDITLPTITGSRLKCNQIFSNIIINAIEAFPLYEQSTSERLITITATHDTRTSAIVVTISDTGSGMSADTQAKLFTTFFTTKTQGIGIGLANTKEIIEQVFSGSISCTSVEHHGTTFTVTFPIVSDHAPIANS